MAARTHNGYRRVRGGGGGGYRRAPARGMFKDNMWHCDCDPPLPAEHFKVKKEGKNQGRWFHTCQQSEPNRCPFFLWDEDAKPREEAAIPVNSHADLVRTALQEKQNDSRSGHNEANTAQGSKSNAQAGRVARQQTPHNPSHDQRYPETPNSLKAKRTAHDAGLDDDDEDEELDWGLSRADELDLARAIERSDPHTPSKAAKSGVYATPSTTATANRKLPWLDPSAFSSPKSPPAIDTPTKTLSPDHTQHLKTPEHGADIAVDLDSPRPTSRFKDALVNPADTSATLTVEALSILASTTLPGEVISKLRSVLSKHDLKTRGVTKGRDISRLALKAKDAKIAELEAKIVSLQADREVDHSIIRNLRWARDQKSELDEVKQDEL